MLHDCKIGFNKPDSQYCDDFEFNPHYPDRFSLHNHQNIHSRENPKNLLKPFDQMDSGMSDVFCASDHNLDIDEAMPANDAEDPFSNDKFF